MGEGRGTAALILNFGIRCRWMVSFRIRPFYTRERTPVTIEFV